MADDRVTGEKQRVTLTWEDDSNQIITFDATPNEGHTGSAEPTDHPIEAGADTSDHIRNLPDELALTGVVSDSPLPKKDSSVEAASTGGDVNQRAISAYEFLRRTKDEGKLLSVFTKLRGYTSMAITSLSVTRDAGSSRIINGEIQLREILIAVTERVEAPTPKKVTRRRKKRKGKKTKTKESEANKDKARKNETLALRGARESGALDFFESLGAP